MMDHHETALDSSRRVHRKWKTAGYVAAWIVALLATGHTIDALSVIWMFPSGLVACLPDTWMNVVWVRIPLGAVIYLVHAFFFFRSRRWWVTLLLYVLLSILLIWNVSGCHEMLRRPGGF